MPPKVSVVVATYRPGPGLDRLVRSLDAQTMPRHEFEVIFVDDGSPDGTWQQLESVRRERGNVSVERIEHSGWPSRPRNVGLAMARGEYVIFVDHDDEILADGLRAAWQFAANHDVDVANVKQIETGNPGHAFEHYRRDVWGTRQEMGVLSLLPMMPHKLYRRALLSDHDITFPEAAGRVLWEDIYFNVDAFAVARRIGTLGSVCVYRHILGDANSSHVIRPENEDYWRTEMSVLNHIENVLGGNDFAADRRALLAHHYRERVLNSVVRMLSTGNTDAFAVALPYMRSMYLQCVSPDVAAMWTMRERRVDGLLRGEDVGALTQLATAVSRVVGTSRTTELAWEGASLVVRTEASWSEPPSSVAPGFFAARTDDEAATIRAELDRASSCLIMRSRATQETTPLDTVQSIRGNDPTDPLRTLSIAAQARIGVSTTGRTGVFDIVARDAALGFTNTRGLRAAGAVRIGLVDGEVIVAYPNQNGMLSVDYGQSVRSAVNSARCDFTAARATRTATGRVQITVPLGGVHVHGTTRIEGHVLLQPQGTRSVHRDARIHPAALIGDDRGARLTATVRARAGRYRLVLDFGGRRVPSGIAVMVPSGLRRPRLGPA